MHKLVEIMIYIRVVFKWANASDSPYLIVVEEPGGSCEMIWTSSEMMCAGLQPYSTYQLRAACFNNMGSAASDWTTVTTHSEGTSSAFILSSCGPE